MSRSAKTSPALVDKPKRRGPGRPFKPGPRGPLSPKHRAHIAAGVRKAYAAKRAAIESGAVIAAAMKSPEVQMKIKSSVEHAEATAWRHAYTDAVLKLRLEGEMPAAERIIDIVKSGKDSDALAAAREVFNRTRGLPTATVNYRHEQKVQELSISDIDHELEQLRARAVAAEDIEALPSPDEGDNPDSLFE